MQQELRIALQMVTWENPPVGMADSIERLTIRLSEAEERLFFADRNASQFDGPLRVSVDELPS